MHFEVAASSYDRFMGRFSSRLARGLVELAEVTPGQRAIDVGCGPGTLTGELVDRLGASQVVAVDPSGPFIEAARSRHPGVEVHRASAEALPFGDHVFDVALAQLVVHFMTDPVGGLREMARVTRPGGVVAASVWDFGGDRAPISLFWRAARAIDPDAPGEATLAGARAGHLASLFADAGIAVTAEVELAASVELAGFDDWWAPFELGVGPAGDYLAQRDASTRAEIERRCRRELPDGAFVLDVVAWAATGVAS